MTLFDLKEAAMKGRKLRRKCWLEGRFIFFEEGKLICVGMADVSLDTSFKDDWEIKPEYVGWKEVFQALKDGKEIIASDGPERFRYKIIGGYLCVLCNGFWNDLPYGGSIPSKWLFQEDFEVTHG